MTKVKRNSLLKTIIVFGVYVVYTSILVNLLGWLGIDNNITTIFIADLLFLFGIIVCYKDDLKQSFKSYSKDYKLSKKITVILKWVIIIFVINFLLGVVAELLAPGLDADENTSMIWSLFDMSSIYTIFKTLLFATIAEELVFKQSVRKIVDKNVLFIIVSSSLYALMNLLYADLNSPYLALDIIGYTMFGVVTSIAYIKNNDNIFIIILIKFIYNLIPLLILMAGA